MFYLNVPYAEKDKASNWGAQWDGKLKKWYVPDDVELVYFKEWIPKDKMEEAEIIIKSQQSSNGMNLSSLLNNIKKQVLDNCSGFYWVNAEIANISPHKSNLYLELIETNNQGREFCKSRAIIFGQELKYIQDKFKMVTGKNLEKGMKVLLRVSVLFDIKFHLTLKILDIEPEFTLGGMEAKVNKIREQIVALGLYDKNKKFTTPKYFKNVAVVSPSEAAGLKDFKADANLLEKHGICNFKYYTAVFQGANTAKEVSKEIQKASFESNKYQFDVIVVIRGGGAKTDLHFLNEFDIAKAIANSSVPVFTGIGHEIDSVFIDEISNKKFDTPSKVINYIAQTNINVHKSIDNAFEKVNVGISRWVDYYKKNNDYLMNLIKSSNKSIVLKFKNNLNNNTSKINENIMLTKTNFKLKIEENLSKIKIGSNNKKEMFKNNINLLSTNILFNNKMIVTKQKEKNSVLFNSIIQKSPLNALDNGYAILKDKDNNIIVSLEQLEKSKSFIIMMKDGEKEIK